MTNKKLTEAVLAIYGRASTDMQRETSIDDQVARCKATAERAGVAASDTLVFSDYAVSGKGSSKHLRAGYADLLDAWKAGKFTVLVADEQSRLFRDEDEAAAIKKLIKTTGVRVITADGIDTAHQGWELLWGIKATVSAVESDQLAFRVKRGMHGSLSRGFTAWDAPYGYDRKPQYAADGEHIGTLWTVNDAQAEVVRRIYRERAAGASYTAICQGLNSDGIPSPRGATWHPSGVLTMLANPTYKGVLTFGGSRLTQWKVRTGQRAPVDNSDFQDEYLRPELALVDEALWDAGQPGYEATPRSKNSHWAAGLVACPCGCRMTAKYVASSDNWSIYCIRCVSKKARGLHGSAPVYIADTVLRSLLQEALKQTLTDEVLGDMKARLQGRMVGSFAAELDEAKAHVARANRVMARLAQELSAVEDDDAADEIHAKMEEAATIRKAASAKVKQLEANAKGAQESHLQAQLSADPRTLFEAMFDTVDGAQLRGMLMKVFPSVVFVGRSKAHTRESLFRVAVAPGEAAAVLTQTLAADSEAVSHTFRVQSSSRREVAPAIHMLGDDGKVVNAELVEVKACTLCGHSKHYSLFPLKNGRPGSYCTDCSKAYQKERAVIRKQQRQAVAA